MKPPKKLNPLIVVISIVLLGSLALFLALNYLIPKTPDNGKSAEGAASQSTIERGEKERAEYPILKYLPINTAVYNIGYQFEADGQPTITIDTTEFYLEYALEKLTSLGTPERPANSYRLKIINWTGSEKETAALKKFQNHL